MRYDPFTDTIPVRQLLDRLWLVAGGLIVGDHLEPTIGARDIANRPELRMRDDRVLSCESHGVEGMPGRRHYRDE